MAKTKIHNFQDLLRACPYYIHSNESENYVKLNKSYSIKSKIDSQTQILNSLVNKRLQQINLSQLRGIDIVKKNIGQENFEEEVLQKLAEDLTTSFNRITLNNTTLNNDLQQLINNKQYFASKAFKGLKGEAIRYQKKAFENKILSIQKLLGFQLNKDEIGIKLLLATIGHKIQRQYPDNTFIKIFCDFYNFSQFNNSGPIICHFDPQDYTVVENFLKTFFGLNIKDDVKKTKQIAGSYTNYFGKDVVEPIVSLGIGQRIENVFKDIDQEIKTKTHHTGQLQLQQQANPSSLISGLKIPTIRADVITENYQGQYIIKKEDSQNVNINFGISVKYLKKTSNDFRVSRYTKDNQIFDRGNISLLTKSNTIRYINEISNNGTNYPVARKYINAYFQNNVEDIETVEKAALINSIMGTGYQIKGHNNLYDVNLLFFLNGKFYSVLQILNKILRDQSGWKQVQINYENLDDVTNTWVGKTGRLNLLNAKNRSDKALDQFKKVVMTMSINPNIITKNLN